MARSITILDEAQRREFDRPPKLPTNSATGAPERFFFTLPGWADDIRRELQTPHTQLGFILQVGYFKMTGRFFSPKYYTATDADYVRRHWRLAGADLDRYDGATIGRHRSLILANFGVASFDESQRTHTLEQATAFARRQMNPVAVFRSTADYVRAHRIEPGRRGGANVCCAGRCSHSGFPVGRSADQPSTPPVFNACHAAATGCPGRMG